MAHPRFHHWDTAPVPVMPCVFEYLCMQWRCILCGLFAVSPSRVRRSSIYTYLCMYGLLSDFFECLFPPWRRARDGLFEVPPTKRATAPVSYTHKCIEVHFFCYCLISLNVSFRNGGVYFVAHLWFHRGDVRKRPWNLYKFKLKTCKFVDVWFFWMSPSENAAYTW